MTIASGALHSASYGVQADFDATQTALKALRLTDCGLAPQRDEFESAEIQSHGQVVDARQGMHQASGDLFFELSYGSFDDFLAAICRSAWAANAKAITATTIAAVASTNKLTDSANGFTFSEGEWVKVAFETTTANNGVYKVTAASAAEVTISGKNLTDAPAGESVTVDGMDALKVGAAEKYMTIERSFADVGVYEVYKSCAVNSMSLSIQPNQMVTGSFSMIAADMESNTSALDAAPDAAPAGEPISGVDVGSILEGGAPIAHVSGVDLTIEGNVGAKPVVGSNSVGFMAWTDAFKVSAKLDAYFASNALMAKFLNETESSLRIVLQDPDGAIIGFELPRVKYTGNSRAASGRDSITESAQVKALYDATDATTITFFRKAA